MYYKRSRGKILIQKLTERWVRWTHRSEGKTHCEECLKLDGRWFSESKTPKWPHHPFCHCALEPIDDTAVLMYAATHSDYSKFVSFETLKDNNFILSPERYLVAHDDDEDGEIIQ